MRARARNESGEQRRAESEGKEREAEKVELLIEAYCLSSPQRTRRLPKLLVVQSVVNVVVVFVVNISAVIVVFVINFSSPTVLF